MGVYNRIWVTYAWTDNESDDVDFIAQELRNAGLEVMLDRVAIGAGRRLWDQIEQNICNESSVDAWLIVATENSLQSGPCREEYSYALDRALSSRGSDFPVMALFLGTVDPEIIPAGIRTRLYVSILDDDWVERIASATQRRQPVISTPVVAPYHMHVHRLTGRSKPLAIEVRPRAGIWAPFFVGIPLLERDAVGANIMHGPKGRPTDSGMQVGRVEGESRDGAFQLLSASDPCTPVQSYYIWCDCLPRHIVFGILDSSTVYRCEPK